MRQAATPQLIELVQGLLAHSDPEVRRGAGKTLAKLGPAAEDMAAKHIPGADGLAKLGWAEGRQELGPEAARSGAAPSARQGPTAAGW